MDDWGCLAFFPFPSAFSHPQVRASTSGPTWARGANLQVRFGTKVANFGAQELFKFLIIWPLLVRFALLSFSPRIFAPAGAHQHVGTHLGAWAEPSGSFWYQGCQLRRAGTFLILEFLRPLWGSLLGVLNKSSSLWILPKNFSSLDWLLQCTTLRSNLLHKSREPMNKVFQGWEMVEACVQWG